MAETTTSNSPEQQAVDSFLADIPSQERKDLEFQLQAFSVRHASHHRPVAVVTSGGTAADLENRSVRCLDNFSTGTRGAVSVEEFLKRGYAVVHLWRVGSASPYGRLVSSAIGQAGNQGMSCAAVGKLFAGDKEEDHEDQLVQSVLQEAQQNDPWLTGSTTEGASTDQSEASKKAKKATSTDEVALERRILHSTRLRLALRERRAAIHEGRLLTVPFRSIEEYLAKLQLCATSARDCQALAVVYLAAAVSDFYIPKEQRSEHKIESADGSLTLQLSPVPKVMGLLRNSWAPDAFVCSFKLETNPDVLRRKAERAVQKYGCHMVVGNILDTRYDEVWVLAPESKEGTSNEPQVGDWPMHQLVKPKSAADPDVLESKLIEYVIQAHFEYISTSCNGSFDKSGAEAVMKAHYELERKKRQLQRDLFWKQAKTVGLEWTGIALGAVLSYYVSLALRKRMNA